MKAKELLEALKKNLKTRSQKELAAALGVTQATLINWKAHNRNLSPSQIASAIAKSRRAAVRTSQRSTIQPIVEFYEIQWRDSAQGVNCEVFDGGPRDKLYAQGLRKALETNRGIYIFYDSQGQALYVGKTNGQTQTLWKEMNLAFNRPREVQKIKLVRHPDRNQEFKPGYAKLRQPVSTQLELCDMAFYFSAYKIDDGMIEELEALMIRAFANNLLNIKMETFANSKNQ